MIKSLVLIILLLTGFAYLTYYERKVLARFHGRYGPNRAGPLGLLAAHCRRGQGDLQGGAYPGPCGQADLPAAPVLALIPALIAYAVIPIGPSITLFGQQINLFIANVNIGFLYILAVASVGTYGVILAGWSSNNKYAMLGSLRTSAQMVSYELAMGTMLAAIVLTTTLATGVGSLSLVELVQTPRPCGCGSGCGSAFPSSSSACWPRPTAAPSICRRRRTSWWPASRPNTAASSSRCSSWPSTST